MDIFEIERALLRLKEMVNVKTDKDIAALLGMDVSAFNKRKKRNSFPERELLALAEARPELGIDTYYVLTGVDKATLKRREQDAKGMALARAELRRQITARPPEPEVTEEESFSQRAALHAAGGLSPVNVSAQSEERLLDYYRRCSPDDQALGLQLLARLAAQSDKRKKA